MLDLCTGLRITASTWAAVLWLESEFPDFPPGAVSIRTDLGKYNKVDRTDV